jgi:MFS family permease
VSSLRPGVASGRIRGFQFGILSLIILAGMVNGPHRALGWGITLWSVAQGATTLASGLWPFVALRGVLGLGEAPMFPSAVSLIRDWWPPRGRGWPTGMINIPTGLAAAIAPPLLTRYAP